MSVAYKGDERADLCSGCQGGNMEGMQTCLRGSGEECLPMGPEPQQAGGEYTRIPVKLQVDAWFYVINNAWI